MSELVLVVENRRCHWHRFTLHSFFRSKSRRFSTEVVLKIQDRYSTTIPNLNVVLKLWISIHVAKQKHSWCDLNGVVYYALLELDEMVDVAHLYPGTPGSSSNFSY